MILERNVTGERVSGQGSVDASGGTVARRADSRFRRGCGVVHIEFLQSLHDDLRDSEVAEPFMIGGNDEPRRIFRTAARKDSFVGVDVIIPTLSFPGIGLGVF